MLNFIEFKTRKILEAEFAKKRQALPYSYGSGIRIFDSITQIRKDLAEAHETLSFLNLNQEIQRHEEVLDNAGHNQVHTQQ